jgi:predicted transcriptional regulator
VTSAEQEQAVKEIARDLGISEDAARALLAAVEAEANPPPGKIVNV